MIKFLASLPKHMGTALVSLKRHLAMTVSSCSAVLVTLLMLALFLILAVNVESFSRHVEQELKIHVSIDSLAADEEIKALKEEIRTWSEVKNVHFSSSEEELEALIEDHGSVFARYKERNPMPNVFLVEVKQARDITAVTKRLKALDGIEKAEYGGESIHHLIDTFETVRTFSAVFLLALFLLALFLITNTIKMTIYTRMNELSIMRSVGAANWYIRTPFVFEGMLIGLLGALFPALGGALLYAFVYRLFDGHFLSEMFVLQPVQPFAYLLLGALLLGGMAVGMIGSFLAVSKYLRWRR